MRKGLLVKSYDVDWTAATSSKIVLFRKPPKHGKARDSSNYAKHPFDPEDPNLNRIKCTSFAASAHMMGMIFSNTYSTKTRVSVPQNPPGMPNDINSLSFLYSKKIEDFMTWYDLPFEEIKTRISRNKREFVTIMLEILLFRDPDKHIGNIAIDKRTGHVCSVDHDMKNPDTIDASAPNATCYGDVRTAQEAIKHFNTLHSANRAFAFISIDDIKLFPATTDYFPFNHPIFSVYSISGNTGNTSQDCETMLKALSEDPEIIHWKFYLITKYLLLMTDENIRTSVLANSVNDTDTQDEIEIQHCIAHRERIKRAMLFTPEYHDFLKKAPPQLRAQLLNEIQEYNKALKGKKLVLQIPVIIPDNIYDAIVGSAFSSWEDYDTQARLFKIETHLERFINALDLSVNILINNKNLGYYLREGIKAFNQQSHVEKNALLSALVHQHSTSGRYSRSDELNDLLRLHNKLLYAVAEKFPSLTLTGFIKILQYDAPGQKTAELASKAARENLSLLDVFEEAFRRKTPPEKTFTEIMDGCARCHYNVALEELKKLLNNPLLFPLIEKKHMQRLLGAFAHFDFPQEIYNQIYGIMKNAGLPAEKLPDLPQTNSATAAQSSYSPR
ncbi:MAG: hypothetical protein A3E84_05175 [Gammaproteobacteria bacterium RIFCSPHIGHO2_12_FULL_42_13]|nr:MAG: hypothetical protein A3E84_05175 [Gammaproteobacteria bacterium RIFCSPHIGHO2_12_FULL_42_13]